MTWIPHTLDGRGSLNLNHAIKRKLGLLPGVTQVLAREINGVVILIPLVGEAPKALQEGRLDTWVGESLSLPVPVVEAAPVVSRTSYLDSQLALEKLRMERATIRAQIEASKLEQKERHFRLRQQMKAERAKNPAAEEPQPPVAPPVPDPAAVRDLLFGAKDAERRQQKESANLDLADAIQDLQPVQLPQAPVE